MTQMQTADAPGDERSVAAFVEAATELTADQRRRVVDQALVLIGALYAHLPLKRAMHAVDPVHRLELLRHRVEGLTDRQFHAEMLSVFTSVRDLHTTYTLPSPYRRRDAVLPFRVERYFDAAGAVRYVVSRVAPGLADPGFAPGVDVTHWNGVPIDRAVELNGERNAGSNTAARRARGLESLTFRPMARLAPPDEDWVLVGYVGEDGQPREIRLPWQIRERQPAPQAVDPETADVRVATAIGIDALVEAIRRAQKSLLVPDTIELEQQMAQADGAPPDVDLSAVSTLPDVLQFREVTTADGDFGYLRIRTFMVDDVEQFLAEVLRILDLLPRRGLIVDVRGNGGGVIMAGEMLLQLFTPRRIEPSRLQFITTPLAQRIANANAFLAPYVPSMNEALEIGAVYSDGFPVFDGHAELCNSIGQRYHGPVALITDALCYSTTDIFAAGFQDHGIGKIVGADLNTGAGGANVWQHALLLQQIAGTAPDIQPLPNDAGMSVAIRRTTRVGDRQGDPLEDLGVVPDVPYRMTRRDVLGTNEDLVATVGGILAQQPAYVLDAAPVPAGAVTTLSVTTGNLSRLDVYVDDHPVESLAVSDGDHTVRLPSNGASARRVEVRGYADRKLAAARRMEV